MYFSICLDYNKTMTETVINIKVFNIKRVV